MPRARPLPSQSELHRLFDYDLATGVLTWRHRADCQAQWNGKWAGHQAGGVSKSNGHMVVKVGVRLILLHRIIWKWMTGDDPPVDIDHEDTDPTNNRWDNLRLATKHQNLRNSRRHKGKSLPKGVSESASPGRLRAAIYVDGRHVYLGSFGSADEAHAAYRNAAAAAFGEFARFD